MMDFHEIIVAEEGGQIRVLVAPAMPLDSSARTFTDRDRAMAYARLLRLQHGFKIVETAQVMR